MAGSLLSGVPSVRLASLVRRPRRVCSTQARERGLSRSSTSSSIMQVMSRRCWYWALKVMVLSRVSGSSCATLGKVRGTAPKFTYKRMLGGGDIFVVEGTVDYGDGVPVSYVGVGEMRDGKVARMTEYFANPFPAPDWRKPFVEQM